MGLIDNVVHLFAPLKANCAEFQSRWDAANSLGPEGASGCWEGEWISSRTGHRGRLRCVLTPVAPALWRMHFRGEYAKVFRACYSTDFTVVQEDGRWTFSGGSNLGTLAGGAYEYKGEATLERLTSSYRSARDEGEFRLTRYRS
jgi:hypothetical protein